MNIHDMFEKYDDEYLRFEDVKNKLSQRPDLHAFILLDSLDPGQSDVVSASEHDEFWLSFDIEVIQEKATEDQIVDLIRCGVRIDDYGEGFAMFS